MELTKRGSSKHNTASLVLYLEWGNLFNNFIFIENSILKCLLNTLHLHTDEDIPYVYCYESLIMKSMIMFLQGDIWKGEECSAMFREKSCPGSHSKGRLPYV